MKNWNSLKNLPLQKKITLLYEHAVFIMAIRYYNYKVNLYLLGNDYVEVFVNHKHASIDRVDLLDTHHTRMKFYSDQIRLPRSF
jgi:hypothetical protein